MPRTTPTFSLDDQPEVFTSSTDVSRGVRRAVAEGRARRIAGRLYTRNVQEPLEHVVGRNWAHTAALLVPGAVIVDRSAFEARPSGDGSLFLDAGPEWRSNRTIRLPGLWLRPRTGPGPLPGDMPHLDGLHYASRARAWLDNMRASRARGGVARTLSPAEREGELAKIVEIRGFGALNELRDQARELSERVTAYHGAFAQFDALVGAMQGTRNTTLRTPHAGAHRRGAGYDRRRVELFGTLQAALLRYPFERRDEQPSSWPALSFFEAYFSNWIEGTEFEVVEAQEIVFERAVPEGRADDAHDVLGTFEVVNDPVTRTQLPPDADALLHLLRAQHATILGRRPHAHPGQFKTRTNRAGATTFVHPDLVTGTLRAGFDHLQSLPAGLAQATFAMFLVAEVHPFTDGNGRLARILMNAALSVAGQQRIVIPIAFRDDCLQALRALSRVGNPEPLVRALDLAQQYAAHIDWTTLDGAQRTLEHTNAFLPPDEAEERGLRLTMPAP